MQENAMTQRFLSFIALIPMLALYACGGTSSFSELQNHKSSPTPPVNKIVDISIVNDQGDSFAMYPADSRSISQQRAYVKAIQSQNFKLRIKNLSAKRLGLVIAVDGQNIINLERSELRSTEPKYVLSAHQQQDFDGWRISGNKIKRFFFTEEQNSYAASWEDYSAMGVIAVAVFEETSSGGQIRRLGMRPNPGTGMGEDAYSPTRTVNFNASSIASITHLYKYMWEAQLCEKNIMTCRAKVVDSDKMVDIQIIDSSSRSGELFTTIASSSPNRDEFRSYVEALENRRYKIRVRNLTNQQIGLVIAVDGQNIINLDRSELRKDEPMYLLKANQTQDFAGWRISGNKVKSFFFTEEQNSFAASWDDYSAMGVIAVAVFESENNSVASASRPKRLGMRANPGTGMGEDIFSPARKVEFRSLNSSSNVHLLKYMWRSQLCQQDIITCGNNVFPQGRAQQPEEPVTHRQPQYSPQYPQSQPRNRFWD